jgi:hypothetical protein
VSLEDEESLQVPAVGTVPIVCLSCIIYERKWIATLAKKKVERHGTKFVR